MVVIKMHLRKIMSSCTILHELTRPKPLLNGFLEELAGGGVVMVIAVTLFESPSSVVAVKSEKLRGR